jgi:uroporphyrinogen-III synthase
MIAPSVVPKKVLITRSHKGNLELAPKLRAMGLEPLGVDVLELSPPEVWSKVDEALRRLDRYDWLLLTSATGATHFADRMRALNIDRGTVRIRIAVVGAKTADALVERGWKVDFVPSRYLTDSLAKELPVGRNALLMRSDIADPSLAQKLRARGFQVEEVTIYRTVRLNVKDLDMIADADMVIFGSPSAVDGLCSQLPEATLANLIKKEAACIGPVTARATRAHGFTRIVQGNTEHTFDSLLEEIRRTHRLA